MTTISVRNNFPEIAAKLDRLALDVGDKAMVRALNKTIVQGKTQMARTISKEFRISVGEAKYRLDINHARHKGAIKFEAVLYATRPGFGGQFRGMNLIHFVRGGRGKGGQLKFQIKRSGGSKTIKGAFIATNRKTGGRAVFIRKDDGTYIPGRKNKKGNSKHAQALETLTTIDVPEMFTSRRVNDVVRKVMLDKFPANFQRELRSVLKGYVK